jgi:hypothetical protein
VHSTTERAADDVAGHSLMSHHPFPGRLHRSSTHTEDEDPGWRQQEFSEINFSVIHCPGDLGFAGERRIPQAVQPTPADPKTPCPFLKMGMCPYKHVAAMAVCRRVWADSYYTTGSLQDRNLHRRPFRCQTRGFQVCQAVNLDDDMILGETADFQTTTALEAIG